MTRVLISDPDPAFRKALALLISLKLDISQIEQAGDTGTLIRKLADNPPDLLLLSWTMHGAAGSEICTLVRNTYPDVKILLLSVNPQDACAAGAVGAGFICKSASPEETLAVLKSVLPDKQ